MVKPFNLISRPWSLKTNLAKLARLARRIHLWNCSLKHPLLSRWSQPFLSQNNKWLRSKKSLIRAKTSCRHPNVMIRMINPAMRAFLGHQKIPKLTTNVIIHSKALLRKTLLSRFLKIKASHKKSESWEQSLSAPSPTTMRTARMFAGSFTSTMPENLPKKNWLPPRKSMTTAVQPWKRRSNALTPFSRRSAPMATFLRKKTEELLSTTY